jgi:hypothetical protein
VIPTQREIAASSECIDRVARDAEADFPLQIGRMLNLGG